MSLSWKHTDFRWDFIGLAPFNGKPQHLKFPVYAGHIQTGIPLNSHEGRDLFNRDYIKRVYWRSIGG